MFENRISTHAAQMALHRASSAPAQLSPREMELAKALMECHGNVRVAREAKGLHFYIACPDCLADALSPAEATIFRSLAMARAGVPAKATDVASETLWT